jgi:G3E family GTPase
MYDISSGKRQEGNAIDAVILVVDAVDFRGHDSILNRLNQFIALLLQRGMTPIIALNKVDTVLIDDLGSVFNSEAIKSRIHELHQETGIPINQIFPVKSYTFEHDREEDVEKLALLCLQEAIQSNVEEDALGEEEESSDFEYDD